MNLEALLSSSRHSLPSDMVEARRVQADIESALQQLQFAEAEIFAIKLALEEAFVNSIKHGNRMDRSKTIRLAYSISSQRFDIEIEDEGNGFNVDDVPDPTAPENLERPCGRGILLMRHYMTEVVFDNGGRLVRMVKVRKVS